MYINILIKVNKDRNARATTNLIIALCLSSILEDILKLTKFMNEPTRKTIPNIKNNSSRKLFPPLFKI